MITNMDVEDKKKVANTVYEIIAAYRQATLHILTVMGKFKNKDGLRKPAG